MLTLAACMLDVDDLHAYYGKSHVLQGVSLRVEKGEIVSLLGRNGAGRSTTIRAIIATDTPANIRANETVQGAYLGGAHA